MLRTSLASVAVLAVAVAATPTLIASAGPASAPPSSSARTLPTEGLDILITNDDGWSAPGIQAVYAALKEAGHNITMVAPAKNNSGVSTSIQFSGTTKVTHPVADDEDIWAVDLTPAGTVLFGLDIVLDEKPDLVISGTNVGYNTGFDTNFSGTIGAATLASGMQDIPALAVSTATVGYSADAPGAYEETADLVVDLLSRGLPVLPRGQFLNVNYPVLTDELPAPRGVAYTANSQASAAAWSYNVEDDPATPEIEYRVAGAKGTEEPAPGTDTAMLRDGWVTFGVLDADRSVDADDVPEIAALVRALNGETAPAPTPSISALPTKMKRHRVVRLGTHGIAKGVEAKIRWEPIANDELKTVKRTVKTKKDSLKLKASQAGRYLVTVTVKKTRAQGIVKVK